MMEMKEIREKVLAMLEEICESSEVREDTEIQLFENGLLDSLAVAELLVAMEDTFDLVLAPSEIGRDEIATPEKIIALIVERV